MIGIKTIQIKEKIREKWNHSGFQRYFKNTGWLFFGRIAGMFISFFVAAYVARYLGPENYGTLSYIVSLVGIFSFIASLGIDNVLYRDLIRYPERENELLGSGIFLKMIGSYLALVIASIILPILGNNHNVTILAFIAACSFLFQSFNVILTFFQSKTLAKLVAISGLFVTLILSVFKIGFAIIQLNVHFFVYLLILEQIAYAIIFIILYQRLGRSIFSWRINRKTTFGMWKESLPLMFSAAFILIYNRIDQVMIKQMLDASAVGYYDIAVRLSEFWYFVPTTIITALLPAIVNAKKVSVEIYRSRIKLLAVLVLVLSLLASIIIFIFSKQIVLSLFGSQYIPSISVLQIYVWAGVGMSIGILANQYLVIENSTKASFFANFLGMFTNVILNLILIPHHGINGAAIATLISYFVLPTIVIIIKRAEIYVKKN